jgi:hypothetical protein
MVSSEESIGTTEHLTLYTPRRISLCRYNRIRLHSIQRGMIYRFQTSKLFIIILYNFGYWNLAPPYAEFVQKC